MELSFGSYVILDERSALMSGDGFDIPVVLQVDPVAYSGAADIEPWGREASSCQITGSVTRQFDNHADAVAWYATHGRALAATPRATLTWAVGGTTQATTTAVLASVTCRRPSGVSVTADYTFVAAPPAAPET